MTSDRSSRRSRIDRRALLQGSAAAGSAALIGRPAVAAATAQEATPAVSPIIGAFDMLAVTVADLRAGLDAGEFTSRDIVQASLDRIAQLDETLNALTQLNPAALDDADALDAELAEGSSRGPMHGIPVILKDNIATADGMENTAGSLAMVGALPTRDAFIVERLREAGAVILGKANLSEWANIRSPRSSSGWSGVGGQTVNPHQTDRSPSGSSSGSAVAVAAGYVTVSIGTETDGSIVSPANCCGVVGIKPTVGLASRMGVIPISHHQDTAGPFGRTVADAAALLTAIAVADPADPAVSSQAGGEAAPPAATPVASPAGSPVAEGGTPSYPLRPADFAAVDYTAPEVLDADGLQGARIGVWRETAGYNYTTDAVFEAAIAALTAAGAEVVDPVALPSFADVTGAPDELNVLLWELKPGIADYIEGYVDPEFPIRTLADVVAFNDANTETSMPWFGQEFLVQSVGMTDLDDPEYVATVARTQQWGREGGIDAVLAEHQLDAIIAPTGQPAWKIDLITGDNFRGASSSASAIAGYPIVSVPAGSGFGMPINVSFIGGAFSEATLIRLAYAFEQATAARIDPAVLPPAVVPPME